MAAYRRKKFYIDRIFQRKFVFLFLALSFLVSAGNVLYLLFYMKKQVEENLYRARIVISNVNEIIVDNVVAFNVVILAVIVLLAIVFYYLIRRRVKYFVLMLQKALFVRQGSDIVSKFETDLPIEFQDLSEVLTDFFRATDDRLQAQRQAMNSLQEFMDHPDDDSRKKALEKIEKICSS